MLFLSSLAHAAAPLPPPPANYVLDEPHVLSAGATQSVESLLIEQDHLTGQQILVAIFNSLQGEDLNERTNLIFQEWKIGQRGQDNGVLLAIYWKEHQARIEVGYGLEQTLTDAHSKDILEDQLIPAMRDGDPDRAISLAVVEILKSLQSPLIDNGRARQILQAHEGRAVVRRWNAPAQPHGGYWVWLVIGMIALIIVFNTVTSADAHFTSTGWYRPQPWRRRWGRDGNWPPGGGGGFWGGFGGGGGGFGGWGGGGGGGGFSGGGGSSGGGGASAGW